MYSILAFWSHIREWWRLWGVETDYLSEVQSLGGYNTMGEVVGTEYDERLRELHAKYSLLGLSEETMCKLDRTPVSISG